MINIPKRSDSIYKEIESFEDYELTQCVAYEMAIRNPMYKEQADEVVVFYNEHREAIRLAFTGLSEVLKDDEFNYDLWKIGADYKFTLYNKIDNINVIPFEDYLYNLEYKHYKSIEIFGKEFYEIIDLFQKNYKPNENISKMSDTELIRQKDLEEIQLYKTNVRDGYSITTGIRIREESAHLYNEDTDDYIEVKTIEEFKQCTESEGFANGDDTIAEIIIEENFSRPKIKVDVMKSKNTTLEIDLNRPLEEIVAYITHIKNDLEENGNILKAPFELLGTELQKADDISKMCTVTKNAKEICFDGRKGITRTQKLADMLFIYDMVKCNKNEVTIRTAIFEYYENEFNKNTAMSDTTFRKYRDIAKDYIDNQRYKELITGVKS